MLIAIAKKGEIISGGAYFPIINDFYFAQQGKGAFRNGKKIKCSDKSDMNHLRCGGHLAFVCKSTNNERVLQFLKNMEDKDYWLTEFGGGAYDMALTASGRGHCFIGPAGLCGHIWDMAASSIIMKEAGCKVTNFDGAKWKLTDNSIISANPVLHEKIMKALGNTKK